ncbi:hypothetical protein [Caballeronia sp. GAFFF1]|uniref:hypothetical protein n=1 Tax=Caballeronia sp. GAFFF1 TaxID=2921779 RepID=UPI00202863A0|nr:hypothetical protein [Caballeronia sp. GAFFF1]
MYLTKTEALTDFRERVEQAIAAFEAKFGTKPAVLVMCASDADIWIEAQRRGIALSEDLGISVDPFATVSGLRSDIPLSDGGRVLH